MITSMSNSRRKPAPIERVSETLYSAAAMSPSQHQTIPTCPEHVRHVTHSRGRASRKSLRHSTETDPGHGRFALHTIEIKIPSSPPITLEPPRPCDSVRIAQSCPPRRDLHRAGRQKRVKRRKSGCPRVAVAQCHQRRTRTKIIAHVHARQRFHRSIVVDLADELDVAGIDVDFLLG